MKDHPYKVCILAAGVGSEPGSFSDNINKAILPINNKAVISYIVEKFDADIEIVIALGHKRDTVKDYLSLAYPDRRFVFVEVDTYSGPGSGPGYSLLACKEHLNTPFVFFTSDTIVLEDIPNPDHNWIGIAAVHETESYCTVKMKNNLVVQLDNKIKSDNRFAFIGLAGIRDHKEFFAGLEQSVTAEEGELEVVAGMRNLVEKRLVPVGFTWFDTGSSDNYKETNRHFSGDRHPFDFSKVDEYLYFVNERVVKFFADDSIVKKRYERAVSHLHGLTPSIENYRGHFYSYRLVPGQTLYNALTPVVLSDFLAWAKRYLWEVVSLSGAEQEQFAHACRSFYRQKTMERISAYESKVQVREPIRVNGVAIPTVSELLRSIDWDYIESGVPSRIHGDLQFDNVIVDKDGSGKKQFVLLDWRHDFGGLMHIGDLYYDLAKLYGGMLVPYPLIKEGMFTCTMSDDNVFYNYFIRSDVMEAREDFEVFLGENKFDLKKVRLLTGLIFLNMAPLHNAPFDSLLHALGRSVLTKALRA